MGPDPWITYTIAGFCGLIVLAGSFIGYKVWKSRQKPDPAMQSLNKFLAAEGATESKDDLSEDESPSKFGYSSDGERRRLVYGRQDRSQRYYESAEDFRQPRPAYMKQQQRAYSPASSLEASSNSPPLMAYPYRHAGPYNAGPSRSEYAGPYGGQHPHAPPQPAQLRGEYWA